MLFGHLQKKSRCDLSFLQNLKSATDDNIPSSNREPQAFTTTAIRFNTIWQFGLVGKGARIINTDATNNLTYRLHSNQGIARIIPPSSEILVREWFAQLHIEPNAVTGQGQLEMELAKLKDARVR